MELLPAGLLAEIFATLSPMTSAEAERRAALAVETLTATRDRAELAQLGLALRALELPPLNAAVGAGFVRFGHASQEQRERILLGWARSRVPQLRTAFQAVKRLGLFLAYADPGPNPAVPHNDRWTAIGYVPRQGLSTPGAAGLTMLLPALDDSDPLRLDADVVVVGSGAGGGLVAARLAAAGRSVLVVEAGPYRSAADVPAGEAEAWRDLYLDRGTTGPDDLSVTILAGATVGGGTSVNWTTTIEPPAWIVDEWAAEHGLIGLGDGDGPGDLARVADELGAMPPSIVPPKDQLIIDGARALGWEAAPTQRNAGPCSDCGACGFGCHRDAKRSTAQVHLPAAQANGARILAEATVTRVLVRAGRTHGVVGRLRGGRRFVVHAPQAVVAAGALRTPLILSGSGIEHREIGRNLRLHPVVVLAALMPQPVEMWCGPTQAARSLEFLAPRGGFLIESAPAHPGLAAAALPWLGRDAGADFLDRLHSVAPLIGIMRDTTAGTVTRRRSGRASIRYRLGREDAPTARRALVAMARLAEAGGADEMLAVGSDGEHWKRGHDLETYLARLARIDTSPNRITLMSAHQMGTARAGEDPRRAPCDPWGRVRADDRGTLIRGAYVADASLFPTAIGVNPMLTIMMLAERTARAALDDPIGA